MSAQHLLRALAWPPHHRLDIQPRHGMLVICSASDGLHQVGSRGDLPLPANARHMCRIEPGQPVLLAAISATMVGSTGLYGRGWGRSSCPVHEAGRGCGQGVAPPGRWG
ncbi:hypothetical protein DDE19_20215 [Micromonospora ureilytica]|uniref:Uncharacterized protein n=1 Tax=Micromonospora ureilytica TaxID=709868 RepID=A0A3N9XRL0_9ACTN|nr:hypothetical protein DDE19_20215 [Micromonospora ureilytica]